MMGRMKYRKLPVEVEAITFDELVEYGRKQYEAEKRPLPSAILHGNMPWSFEYNGHPITHENDDCYIIPTLEGLMKFKRGDMLITGVAGELYPCEPHIFAQTYEAAL
jgi:hypothetical protein